MSDEWSKLRNDFPVTKKYVYLANAAVSPIPKLVYEQVLRSYSEILENGSVFWKEWIDTVQETKNRYANFIGTHSFEVAFTHSTSEGMNIIAHLLSDKGDVISNELEYPSTNLPWLNKRSTNVVFVKPKEENRIDIDDIYKTIDRLKNEEKRKVKTIVTSHVQFSTGFRQDLRKLSKLCKENDLFLVVNSTQSQGALYLDVKEFEGDFMVSNGHKWMLSSFGIGTLFIKKELLSDKDNFMPSFYSQSGQKYVDRYDNNTKIEASSSASRFEIGSLPIQNIMTFNAALKYITTIGIKKIEDRILTLTDYLIEKIRETEYQILSPIENREVRSGIIVFRIPGKNSIEIVNELEKKYNVIVSARGNGIRVSPHFYNNEQDIDNLLGAIKKIIY